MFKKNCACGKANKNFKYDIGTFYVDECCKAAGYDDLGQRKSSGEALAPTGHIVPSQPSISPNQPQFSAPQQSSTTDRILGFLGIGAKKLTKSKLGELRVDEIKKIAADRGIAGSEVMTRAQLTEALLK